MSHKEASTNKSPKCCFTAVLPTGWVRRLVDEIVNQAPALQKLLMEKEAAASPIYPHVSPTAIRYCLLKARAQSREMEIAIDRSTLQTRSSAAKLLASCMVETYFKWQQSSMLWKDIAVWFSKLRGRDEEQKYSLGKCCQTWGALSSRAHLCKYFQATRECCHWQTMGNGRLKPMADGMTSSDVIAGCIQC